MSNNSKQKSISNYWKYIGLDEKVSEDGISRVELPIKEDLLQRRNTVHGGVIASVIDASMGASIRSLLEEGQAIVTIEMKLNYIRPGVGTLLVGKGEAIHVGKTVATAEAKVINDEGKLIASGMGTFKILSNI